MKSQGIALVILSLLAAPSYALVPPDYVDIDPLWRGNLDFGFNFEHSTVKRREFSTAGKMGYSEGIFEQQLEFKYDFAKERPEDGQFDVTKNRGALIGQSNFDLDSNTYAFGRFDLNYDEFSSLRERYTLTSGFAYRLLNSRYHKLSFELGPGYRYLDGQDNKVAAQGGEPIARGALNYYYRFMRGVSFSAQSAVEPGLNNTLVSNNLELDVALAYNLSLVMAFEHNYSQKVAPDYANNEYYSKLKLRYRFLH